MNIRKQAYAAGIGLAVVGGATLGAWLAVETSYWLGERYLVPLLGEWAKIAPLGAVFVLLLAWAFGHLVMMDKSPEGTD